MQANRTSLSGLTTNQLQLIGWRVARGMALPEAAALEGIEADDARLLSQDAEFIELSRHYRQIIAASEEDRRSRWIAMAWRVLERGIEDGDPRAMQFLCEGRRRQSNKPDRAASPGHGGRTAQAPDPGPAPVSHGRPADAAPRAGSALPAEALDVQETASQDEPVRAPRRRPGPSWPRSAMPRAIRVSAGKAPGAGQLFHAFDVSVSAAADPGHYQRNTRCSRARDGPAGQAWTNDTFRTSAARTSAVAGFLA